MAKEFNLIWNENAPYEEVVDTFVDVFRIGSAIEEAASDGWQWTDLLTIALQQATIREVIDDAPVFWAQFKQLSPTTAKAALKEARDKIGQLGKVGQMAYNFLFEVAETYGFIEQTANNGITRYNAWRSLFAGAEGA